MKPQSLKLTDLVTDAGTQSRSCITEDVVDDYMEKWVDGVKFPPVVVFHDGSRFILADGFHRVLAASRLEFKDILADVRKGTLTDALAYAIGSNREHGLRRTNADKRRCVTLALRNFGDWSDRKIATHVGVGHPLVASLRREVQLEEIPVDGKRTGRDGKARKAPQKISAGEPRSPIGNCGTPPEKKAEAPAEIFNDRSVASAPLAGTAPDGGAVAGQQMRGPSPKTAEAAPVTKRSANHTNAEDYAREVDRLAERVAEQVEDNEALRMIAAAFRAAAYKIEQSATDEF